MAKLFTENLPRGMEAGMDGTDLPAHPRRHAAIYIGPLCILLVFLVLAALYESFRLPLAIILIVPMCLLFAIAGVWLKGSDNNIFTQIGLTRAGRPRVQERHLDRRVRQAQTGRRHVRRSTRPSKHAASACGRF